MLGGIILLSAATAFWLQQAPVNNARIYQDGVLIKHLDLSAVVELYSFPVERGTGFNVIAVERGRIRVLEANCPDGSCVRQGWVSGGSIPIVCLPHRLVIRLEGGVPLDVDAVVG